MIISDLVGHTIYTTRLPVGAKEKRIELPALPNGIYMATITNGSYRFFNKVVVAR